MALRVRASTRSLPRFLEEPVRLHDPRVPLWTGGNPPGPAARPLFVDPVERGYQLGKVDVAVDAAEALLGRQHARGGPSQAHRRVPPARDVPRGPRDHRVHRLHDVRRGKRLAQIIRQPQADERQHLGHALPERPRRSGADVVVFLRLVIEEPLRLSPPHAPSRICFG